MGKAQVGIYCLFHWKRWIGFTVLDVTNPIVEPAGPLHSTVYNDYKQRCPHRRHDGDLTSYEYASGRASLTQSEERQIALNYNQARQDDGKETLWTQDTIDDAIADGTFMLILLHKLEIYECSSNYKSR